MLLIGKKIKFPPTAIKTGGEKEGGGSAGERREERRTPKAYEKGEEG